MEKVLLFALIGIIFLVAWLYGKKNTKVDTKVFQEIENVPDAINNPLAKKDKVSGKTFKRIYPILNERSAKRKEKHWMRVYEYNLLGIVWTPFGLYWKTRQLAEEHK